MNKDEILHQKVIDAPHHRLRMTKFSNSLQKSDLSSPTNCDDFGRVHHFRRFPSPHWIENPLPQKPVSEFFGTPMQDVLPVQLFQLSVCNINCWYCFVDKKLRQGNPQHSAFRSPYSLLKQARQENRPPVIVLSGGQPDLAPEYNLWFLQAREALNMTKTHFIWTDDNLSTDLFLDGLSSQQQTYMLAQKGYARVGCLKGFDSESAAFNARTNLSFFDAQMKRLKRLVQMGFNQYAYVTLTTPTVDKIDAKMNHFMDRIQTEIGEQFLARVVPLEIYKYNTNSDRYQDTAASNQYIALQAWQKAKQGRTKTLHHNDLAKGLVYDNIQQHVR